MVKQYGQLYLDARHALLETEDAQTAGMMARHLLCHFSRKSQEAILADRDLYASEQVCLDMSRAVRRLLDGQVVEFDRCRPSYTAMKDSGVYVYCLVDSGLLPYEDFLTDGKRRQAEALKGEGLAESGDPLSNFFVSCVPWLAYTQLKHPVTGPEDTNPRFSWGKFTEMNGRVTMPVTVFVNHALADGLHIARFYENLNQELAEIVKQIKNS